MSKLLIDRKTVEQALSALECEVTACDSNYPVVVALRTALEQPAPSVEPFAWITHESVYRLQKGGNHKGTVPVHKVRSHTAKIPVHITLPVIRTVENTDG